VVSASIAIVTLPPGFGVPPLLVLLPFVAALPDDELFLLLLELQAANTMTITTATVTNNHDFRVRDPNACATFPPGFGFPMSAPGVTGVTSGI
jgi:hypothetical protein